MVSDTWIISIHLLRVLKCLQVLQISLGFGTVVNA